jgi:cytochrome c oxidase subunit IV
MIVNAVYIVMIDSKGVLAFQPFTRQRWEVLEALYKKINNPDAVMLFKIMLSPEEQYAIKWMIRSKNYMAAALELTALRIDRGDAE